jgi:peptide-methionine (S)-S-oxide reductase
MNIQTIYLGAGCFWCSEAVFQNLRGVSEVIPGYMGGTVKQPSYEAVSTGTTGHAEVVKVMYDETVITTDDILDVFFATHNPTTLNQQGNDIGSQYRSIIFYTTEMQRDASVRAIARAQEDYAYPIVTDIASAGEFYPAEEYHYNYYLAHTTAPYCMVVINPKLEKLQARFATLITTN